jgi:hypothetical protein
MKQLLFMLLDRANHEARETGKDLWIGPVSKKEKFF